jgi:hypothetical protein
VIANNIKAQKRGHVPHRKTLYTYEVTGEWTRDRGVRVWCLAAQAAVGPPKSNYLHNEVRHSQGHFYVPKSFTFKVPIFCPQSETTVWYGVQKKTEIVSFALLISWFLYISRSVFLILQRTSRLIMNSKTNPL